MPWGLPTGLFIRDYLMTHRHAYVEEMWRGLKNERKLHGNRWPSYRSFRNYVYVLRKLGLIEFEGERKSKGTAYPRRYYRINPNAANDPRWASPQRALFNVGGATHKKKRRL